MKLKRILCLTTLLLTVILATSFPHGRTRSQETRKPYQRIGNEGIITGNVLFAGKAPAARRIDTSADPACAIKSPRLKTESLVVNNGQLVNAFVYIKAGAALDELSFETPAEPVIIDQKGCRYVPHVTGVQVNQLVEILNSDPTTHNTHPTPRNNKEWNQSQAPEGSPIRQRFIRPEVMIPIKCNQHPWMKAYVGVLPHPFFSVSSREGMFRIEGLPPGNYIIAAWHEQLGEKTMEVVILPGSQQHLTFEFNPVG